MLKKLTINNIYHVDILDTYELFLEKKVSEDAKAILDILKRDCAPFLDEISKMDIHKFEEQSKNSYSQNANWFPFLFRGVGHRGETIIKNTNATEDDIKKYNTLGISGGSWVDALISKKTVRSSRFPRDTPQDIQDQIDMEFSDKFDITPRSNGIFTTGKFDMANGYGTGYLVFPIGDFKFVWSHDIDDLYTHIDGADWMIDGESDSLFDHYQEEYGENRDGEWVYDGTPTGEHNFDDAIEAVKGDSDPIEEFGLNILNQKAVDEEGAKPEYDFDKDELHWEPRITYDEFVDRKRDSRDDEMIDEINRLVDLYQTDDLESAILSGHEVMIVCQEYYLVNVNKYPLKRPLWPGHPKFYDYPKELKRLMFPRYKQKKRGKKYKKPSIYKMRKLKYLG